MSKPLPLAQLAAFEAAARDLSFTAAAVRLNVQQPAISRQVAMLEADLETRLFSRTKPRLTLTADGAALYRAVSDGFDAIRSELRRMEARRRDGLIVVNAAIGFTSLYLMPRLAEFQSLPPRRSVQIVTRDQNLGYDVNEADVVVTFGMAPLPGCESGPVFPERLVPICARGFLPGDVPVELDQLASARLLHMSSADHADDWARYFDGTGFSPPAPEPAERIMSYMVYLHSIQNGDGIGLGWRALIERMVSEGGVVIAADRTVETGRAYWANVTPRAAKDEGARAFVRWLSGRGDAAVE